MVCLPGLRISHTTTVPPTFHDLPAKELTTFGNQRRFAWPGTDLKLRQGLEAISVGVDSALTLKSSWAHAVQRSSCSGCYSCQFVPVFTDHRLHHALRVMLLAGRLEFELCLEVRMKGPVIRSVVSGSIRVLGPTLLLSPMPRRTTSVFTAAVGPLHCLSTCSTREGTHLLQHRHVRVACPKTDSVCSMSTLSLVFSQSSRPDPDVDTAMAYISAGRQMGSSGCVRMVDDLGWDCKHRFLSQEVAVRVARQVVRRTCWAVSAARRGQVSVIVESRESDTP